MAQVIATMTETEVEYLWILDSRTTARPDALAALVSTADQVEASVVGSEDSRRGQPRATAVGRVAPPMSSGFPTPVWIAWRTRSGAVRRHPGRSLRRAGLHAGSAGPRRRDSAVWTGNCRTSHPDSTCASVPGWWEAGWWSRPPQRSSARASGEDRVYTWREQAGRLRVMLKTYSGVTLLVVGARSCSCTRIGDRSVPCGPRFVPRPGGLAPHLAVERPAPAVHRGRPQKGEGRLDGHR